MEVFTLCKEILKEIQGSRVKFDEDENNFYIQFGEDKYLDIDYCPFCGKQLITKEFKEEVRK